MGFTARLVAALFYLNISFQCVFMNVITNLNVSSLENEHNNGFRPNLEELSKVLRELSDSNNDVFQGLNLSIDFSPPENITKDSLILDMEELAKAFQGLKDINIDAIKSLNTSTNSTHHKIPLSPDMKELSDALEELIEVNNGVVESINAASSASNPYLDTFQDDWNFTEDYEKAEKMFDKIRSSRKGKLRNTDYSEDKINFNDLFKLPTPEDLMVQLQNVTANRSNEQQNINRKILAYNVDGVRNESNISQGNSTEKPKLHKREITRPMERVRDEKLRFLGEDYDNLEELEEIVEEAEEEEEEPISGIDAKHLLPLLQFGQKVKSTLENIFLKFKNKLNVTRL